MEYKQCMDLPSHGQKKLYVNFFDDQDLEKGYSSYIIKN